MAYRWMVTVLGTDQIWHGVPSLMWPTPLPLFQVTIWHAFVFSAPTVFAFSSLLHIFGQPSQVSVHPMLRDHCPVCNIGVLWSNGWMNQDATWYEVGLCPDDIVLDGDPAPPHGKGHSTPSRFLAHVCCGQMVAHLSHCWARLVMFLCDQLSWLPVSFLGHVKYIIVRWWCIQCFDTVGLASGRASNL